MREALQRGRLNWFIAVGCAAAAVHWGMVLVLVGQAGLRPLFANVLGWLVAFMVSFSGHFWLTFQGHGVSIGRAALRFAMVSALGFGVNEAAYAVLLRWSNGRHYALGLAAVLVVVAGMTYVLSRHWAFLRTPQP
jgi:putative flippase GtrA